MRLPVLPIATIVLLVACGGSSAGTGPDGSGGTGASGGSGGIDGSGGSGGTAGTGGTGGSGGTGPAFTEVDACADYDAAQATDADPFTLAARVGTDLPVGTDVEAEVMGFDAALTRIDFWSDDLGRGFEVHWPRAESLFAVGERIRVRQTSDWLSLRSTVNETLGVLHVSTGALPRAGALEALPEDGPTLRFVPQCALPAAGDCRGYAVAVEATDGEQTVVMPDGYPWGFDGSRWNIQAMTALRAGCGEDGFAAVIVGDGLLWF